MTTKRDIKATQKQKKAIENLVGNGGNVTKAMREAGYSEGTVNTPQKLTESKGFKEAAKPFAKKMREARRRAIDGLTKVEGKASYRDRIDAVDKLTKNINLLEGESTENITYTIIDSYDE